MKVASQFMTLLHKGDNGCVLILGGSELYTGAAYFSSQASISLGVDLIYIFTSGISNITSLKTLNPGFIVVDINTYKEPNYDWILNRVTCIIYGPGLSRIPNNKYYEVLRWFSINKNNISIIIDGDGLFHIQKYYFDTKFENIILTPNYNEVKWVNIDISINKWVIKKGSVDYIQNHEKIICKVKEFGSIRRCCGQGDILTGILSAFISNYKLKNSSNKIGNICIISSLFLRFLAKKAYMKTSLCMTSNDCLKEISILTLKHFMTELKNTKEYKEIIDILKMILEEKNIHE